MTAVLLVAAAAEDVKSCRVSNYLILAGYSMGIFVKIRQDGYMGMLFFLWGAAVPVFLLWCLFLFRMLGAGDIKLFSVIGGLYGTSFTMEVIVAALFLGAGMSVFHLLKAGGFKYRLHYLAEYVSNYLKTGERLPYYVRARDGKKPVIHFAVAVLGGFLLCIGKRRGI